MLVVKELFHGSLAILATLCRFLFASVKREFWTVFEGCVATARLFQTSTVRWPKGAASILSPSGPAHFLMALRALRHRYLRDWQTVLHPGPRVRQSCGAGRGWSQRGALPCGCDSH